MNDDMAGMRLLPEAQIVTQLYLTRPREGVKEARRSKFAVEAVRAISIEECLAPGVEPVSFEREWHGRNLKAILERRIFTLEGTCPVSRPR